MNRHPNEELLALYAGADTKAQESAEIAAHLQECAVCRTIIAEFENHARALQDVMHEPGGAELKSVRGSVMERISKSRTSARRLAFGLAAGLAAMLLLLFIGVSGRNSPRAPVFGTPVTLPSAPLVTRELSNLVAPRPHTPRVQRAGLRGASLIMASDGSAQLRLRTADPNVVILLPLSEVKNTHEN